jgi:hypothetical protein
LLLIKKPPCFNFQGGMLVRDAAVTSTGAMACTAAAQRNANYFTN